MKKIRTWANYNLDKRENKKLTPEMESFLFEKLNTRERNRALEELINSLRNTIHYTAKKFYWSNIQYEDLIAVGIEGIISATETYSAEKNTRFSTFATYYIIGRIRRIVDLENSTIKKPSHINRLISKINKLEITDPKEEEITFLADKKTSLEQLKIALEKKNQKTYDIQDYKELEHTDNDVFLHKIMVAQLLEALPEIEKKALVLKFGLLGEEIHTYKALDLILNKDSEIIVFRALKRLKELFTEDLLL